MTGTPSASQQTTAARRYKFRMFKDRIARHGVAVGGMGVIFAIVLIFFYLFYVVSPMLVPASAEPLADYGIPGGSDTTTLHMEMEELNEMAVRYTADGRAIFFSVDDGTLVLEQSLTERPVVAVAPGTPGSGTVVLTLDDGTALAVKHVFKVSYPNDVRTITPHLEFPYGEEPLLINEAGIAPQAIGMRDGEDQLLFASYSTEGGLQLVTFYKESSFLDDSVTLEREVTTINEPGLKPRYLLITPNQRRLYAVDGEGELLHYRVSASDGVQLVERVKLLERGQQLTSIRFLVGGMSLLVGSDDGTVAQWFPVRDERNQYALTRVRDFSEQQAAITSLAIEERRKGFAAADSQGRVGVYHTTAQRTLFVEPVSEQPLTRVVLSPRADRLLAVDAAGQLFLWEVHNEHPEVSWHSLWQKVHYEGYEEPQYVWQSSSSSNDFEPKLSLVPLSFGTLKAAFYAMLFAVPLAIFGAIYTAYFMAPKMRQVVKPTIEVMEALPTVILGFLAGLWLAPLLEENLPAFFAVLLIMPFTILLFGFLWRHAPDGVRHSVPDGWEAALLIPVVIFATWLAFALSAPLEHLFFGGDMRSWLYNEMGLSFDQRNSMVVGLAMGFAVIPTIFSITEDAIFSVPKHLTFGSLALGASPWQTLSRVVILTASPGIFSAVMIGLGRAVGETMIVLMATGNTPVMDLSIFQGMRTLSANVAVEMPESEVGSSHYRVLFLAALVLFMFTFVFNTLAEVVRQRLRRRYASL